ncbi:MAG: magnesium transporter CorA family protein [Planctomycetes bacterium]|nr:magnesium transporter CorA family protein [Dehalococcoidia bacterium]MCB9825582.1 magnesium transporter CorA family protein [Planctomycetota bacterium]MCB9902331.1 magnesium transporter CorA family protein [Planctomycetota bacterium]
MIRTWFLDDPRAAAVQGLPDAEARHRPHWVEVVEPDDAEQRELKAHYGVHDVTLGAAMREGHPPRLLESALHVGVILQTPLATTDKGFRKIGVLLADGWVLTVLRKPLAPLQHMLQHLRAKAAESGLAPGDVLYALLDQATLGFEGLADAIYDRALALERSLDEDANGSFLKELLSVRQDLLRLNRSLRRQRDVIQSLSRHEHPVIGERLRPYLRDVADHMTRVYEMAEAAREGILALRDTHLSLVNNRLSETMRVLTVIATIMMPLSLVAGIYGMNVENLPGGRNPLAIWAILGGMVVVAVGMLAWFRRRHWL